MGREEVGGDWRSYIAGGTPSTENSEYWNGNINWFTPTEIGKKNIYLKVIER